MEHVSAFTQEDIPAVAALSRIIFPRSAEVTEETLRERFLEVFFHYPGYNADIPSLVYRDESGRVIGFLGVMERKMMFCDRPIRVAVSHHYMVDPGKRSIAPSIELLKAFMSGPQDLAMTDMANDISRTLWERLGGSTSLIHSILWRKAVRPGEFAQAFVEKKKLLSPLLPIALRPVTLLLDAVAPRISRSPFHLPTPRTRTEELTTRSFLDVLTTHTGAYALKPTYDVPTLDWLLATLEHHSQLGSFHKELVYDQTNVPVGWFMYFLNAKKESEVIQIGANTSSIGIVLDHLFYDAWMNGAVDLTGRADPRFMRDMSEKSCLFFPGRLWMLTHSHNPDILHAIDHCDAFLSRLEGDLWLV